MSGRGSLWSPIRKSLKDLELEEAKKLGGGEVKKGMECLTVVGCDDNDVNNKKISGVSRFGIFLGVGKGIRY